MNNKSYLLLIQHLIQETMKTIIGIIAISSVTIWIYAEYIPNELLFLWIAAQSLFLFLRYKNANLISKYIKMEDIDKVQLNVRTFSGLMIVSAILWNVIVLLGYIYAPAIYIFFAFAVVAGLVTAAVISLPGLLKTYYIYFFLLWMPQFIYIYTLEGKISTGILLILLVYIPYILTLSKSVNKNLVDTITSNIKLEETINKLHKISITDELTNAFNRRYFFQASKKLIELAKRENRTSALLMIDLDYFKNINDKYGHQGGDEVLILLVSLIEGITRKSDVFARIGGEEFAMFLYGVSNDEAEKIGNKLCTDIEEHIFIYNSQVIDVTVSIGISVLTSEQNTLELLYTKSDLNLYKAKQAGRNCAVLL